MPQQGRKKCRAQGCNKYNGGENNTAVFGFPKDPVRCRVWVQNCGNRNLLSLPVEKLSRSYYLCSDHFEPQHFWNKFRRRLHRNAVPTLFSGRGLTDEEMARFDGFCVDKDMAEQEQGPTLNLEQRAISPDVLICSTPGPSNVLKRMQEHLSSTYIPGIGVLDTSVAEEEQSFERCDISPVLPLGKKKRTTHDAHLDEQDGTPKRLQKRRKKASAVLEMSGLDPEDIETPRKKALLKTAEEYKEQARKMALKVDKLKSDCKGLYKMMREKKNVEDMEELVSPGVWVLVKGELENFQRQPCRRRWSMDQKTFALAAYKRSPKMYRFLRCVMTMPSERTLQRLLMDIPLEPGFSSVLLKHLKMIMEKLPEDDRKCVLMFDEMALQTGLSYYDSKGYVVGYQDYGEGLQQYGIPDRSNKVADHALVFMIQGIRRKCKQPIAFFFSKGNTKIEVLVKLVEYAIRILFEHNVLVVATVCDQAPCNQRTVTILRQSCEEGAYEPVFKLDGRLIVLLYDVPHILKNVRNNFLTADLVVGEEIASWEHIVAVFRHDRGLYKVIPKLTEKQMYPRGKGKMRVKYAAQVFSKNTHDMMMTFFEISQGTVCPGPDVTAKRVKDANKFFDLSNGPSGPKDVKEFRCNVSKDSPHVEEWRIMKDALRDWHFVKKCDGRISVPPCIKGWISTVTGMERLWNSVKDSFKYLNLQQLNQDSLENLFAVLRDTCGSNDSPTCVHFVAALKTAVVNGLVSSQLKGKNCEDDEGNLLSNLRSFLEGAASDAEELQPEESIENAEVEDLDVASLIVETPEVAETTQSVAKSYYSKKIERQAPTYVCGYFVKRMPEDSDCALCRSQLTCSVDERSSDHTFIAQREMKDGEMHLTYPSKECINAFRLCEKKFVTNRPVIAQRRDLRDLARKLCGNEGDIDYSWLSCPQHKNIMLPKLIRLLARTLVTTKVKREHEDIQENYYRGQKFVKH